MDNDQGLWDQLLGGAAKYISLGTRKRDGSVVRTPVWYVSEGADLVVTTQGSSGKAKRVRNFPQVDLAACDMRGKLRGPIIKAVAHQITDPDSQALAKLFRKKYGLMYRLMTLRTSDDRVFIRITRHGLSA